MTVSEAVRQYRGVNQSYKVIYKLGPPKIPSNKIPDQTDEEASAMIKNTWTNFLKEAEAITEAAGRAVESLPREEWRRIVRLVYLDGMTIDNAAYKSFTSERTAKRYLQQAFLFWATGEMPGKPGRPKKEHKTVSGMGLQSQRIAASDRQARKIIERIKLKIEVENSCE